MAGAQRLRLLMFFQRYARPDAQEFRLSSSWKTFFWDTALRPFAFGFQIAFPTPFVVVKTQRGTLAGRLGPDFVRANDLPLDLGPHLGLSAGADRPWRISLDAAPVPDSSTGPLVISYKAMLKADGTFSVDLPPGRYDLALSVLGPSGALQRRIFVDQGLTILEGLRSVIERP